MCTMCRMQCRMAEDYWGRTGTQHVLRRASQHPLDNALVAKSSHKEQIIFSLGDIPYQILVGIPYVEFALRGNPNRG